MKRGVKIVSDGTPNGTRLIDTDTGAEIRYVSSITWRIDSMPMHFATATVEFTAVPIEANGELRQVEPPWWSWRRYIYKTPSLATEVEHLLQSSQHELIGARDQAKEFAKLYLATREALNQSGD